MAPINAAPTTISPSLPDGASMMPLPTVLATAPPKNEPMKLKIAARSKAIRGVSARVETDVAIALAAS